MHVSADRAEESLEPFVHRGVRADELHSNEIANRRLTAEVSYTRLDLVLERARGELEGNPRSDR
jgi:hypothetical protein